MNEIGEVQRDRDGVWVVVAKGGMLSQPSRVRAGSLAHHVHAEKDPRIAKTLPNQKET